MCSVLLVEPEMATDKASRSEGSCPFTGSGSTEDMAASFGAWMEGERGTVLVSSSLCVWSEVS